MELTPNAKAVERISTLYTLSSQEVSTLIKEWGIEKLSSSEFIDTDTLGSSYRHKLAAFLVLSHAVIENFLEELCCHLIEHSFQRYKRDGYVDKTLLMFSLHQTPITHKFDDSQWEDQEPIALDQITRAVIKFTKDIRDNNHGIKFKYLNKILRPVGLDLNEAVRARFALQTLGELRGSVAHRFLDKGSLRPVQTFENPDRVYSTVINSLKVAKHLRNKAYVMISDNSDPHVKKALSREFTFVLKKYKENKQRPIF